MTGAFALDRARLPIRSRAPRKQGAENGERLVRTHSGGKTTRVFPNSSVTSVETSKSAGVLTTYVRGAISAEQSCPPRVARFNLTWWGLRTSIDDGKAGQLELPLRTTANFAPASSQPATGTGEGNDGSSAQEPGLAVIASDGSPPLNSDSEIVGGAAEHPVSTAAKPNTLSRSEVPIQPRLRCRSSQVPVKPVSSARHHGPSGGSLTGRLKCSDSSETPSIA